MSHLTSSNMRWCRQLFKMWWNIYDASRHFISFSARSCARLNRSLLEHESDKPNCFLGKARGGAKSTSENCFQHHTYWQPCEKLNFRVFSTLKGFRKVKSCWQQIEFYIFAIKKDEFLRWKINFINKSFSPKNSKARFSQIKFLPHPFSLKFPNAWMEKLSKLNVCSWIPPSHNNLLINGRNLWLAAPWNFLEGQTSTAPSIFQVWFRFLRFPLTR